MPLQLYKIASNDLTASTATVTFSNIPQGYTDLKVVMSARTDGASLTTALNIYYNSDTGANYSYRRLLGSGSAASSDSGAAGYVFINGNTTTSNTFGNLEIYIPNYRLSNQKSFSTDIVTETNATTIYSALVAGQWTGTAAINSISFFISNNFTQYSTFTLYGIL